MAPLSGDVGAPDDGRSLHICLVDEVTTAPEAVSLAESVGLSQPSSGGPRAGRETD
jgi:hypothetical protein